MPRQTTPLTVDHLAPLAEAGSPCGGCLFWELHPVRRRELRGAHDEVPADELADELAAWVSTLLREWGSCGRVVVLDGEVVGWAVYAPEAFLPGVGQLPTAPVSADAVLLTRVWVAPRHRGAGLGRQLVQATAADLVQRGWSAIEAFGRTDARTPAPPCVLSADFLGRVGFRTQRDHVTTPRMRMDLRTTLPWRKEVGAAVDRLRGALRPVPSPPPTATRSQTDGLR